MLEQIATSWWHIPILMGMILVYGILLDLVLFKPLQAILAERKRRIEESSTLSVTSRETLQQRLNEYEQAVLEAHRRATRVKEEARNQATAHRAEVLAAVKDEVDRERRRKEADLKANVAQVKRALEGEIPAMARLLSQKILGREVSV